MLPRRPIRRRVFWFVQSTVSEQTCLCVNLQAKNEPAGKKPADKNDAKKSAGDRRHSSDSK